MLTASLPALRHAVCCTAAAVAPPSPVPRLTHLQPADLGVLRQLRSLFCLALSAPAVDGQLLPGFPSAVRLPEVVDLVRDCLPYCDVELQPEPNLSNLY